MYRVFKQFLLLSFLALFISSCGITRKSSAPDSADYSDYSPGAVIESGVASWYGPNFNGKLTANGETYNMDGLTAAHRSLPFNTIVQVENKGNGKTVIVRINDRGPYAHNRIIDLSRKAAREIEMIDAGTANVEIFLVEEGDRPLSEQNLGSIETFTVQLASFKSRSEAENFLNQISGARIETIPVAGNTVYRIYYGTYDRPDEARTAMQRLRRQGFDGFVKQTQN
ncbi:septal ring lytic transglycosylase RlpA family protein [Rhodohalobacter sp.]|uniref:septal ring lytic transglycosylase RlpA family protein n=1 Tax=Rhodohalobacter sp. TaxID=1974210 RepID=UPI003569C98E